MFRGSFFVQVVVGGKDPGVHTITHEAWTLRGMPAPVDAAGAALSIGTIIQSMANELVLKRGMEVEIRFEMPSPFTQTMVYRQWGPAGFASEWVDLEDLLEDRRQSMEEMEAEERRDEEQVPRINMESFTVRPMLTAKEVENYEPPECPLGD